MLKKSVCCILVFLFVCSVSLFVSCNQDPGALISSKSPTIRGAVSIPNGSGLTGSDFYVRIMEGEKAVYTGKVSSDGSFVVAGLKENAEYSILLTTEQPGDVQSSSRATSRDSSTSGYGGWMSNVTATLNEQAGVGSIKVKPLGTIKGKVVKEGSEDGYDTTVYIPGTSYLAMTDEEGNYSIFNVPQSTYRLRYISNGYIARMVEEVVLYSDSDTENPVTTVPEQTLIKNAGNLIGTITKTGSVDHSNITVMLSDGENTYTGSTKADGSLLISGIAPGTYDVTISSSGFITRVAEGIKIEAAKNASIEPISLIANGGSITGTVSMNDGGEKAGVLVTATSSDEKYSYTTSTNSEGRFTIANAYPGTYSLTLSKVGYVSSFLIDVSSIAGQTSNIGIINLPSKYGSVSGKVSLTDSVDNSGVTVTLTFTADPTIVPVTISGADGTYSFSNLTSAGQYSLMLSKDGYVSSTGTVVNVSLGQNTVVDDVTLTSLASKVSGKVTLEGTEDFTGISVLLKAADNSRQYDATTDQNGNYVMARVNPGKYNLTVSKAGFVSKTVDSIIVESSTEKTLDAVALNIGTRSVSGNVTLELRKDHSGALVTATNLSDKTVYSAISNSYGDYTIAGMKPGEYAIAVSCSGYNTATLHTINITEGNETSLDSFELPIARGIISGTATLEGRGTNAGVTVELLKGTEVYASTTTDDSGAYAFNVPQGNYSGVRLTCENFKSVSIAQDIALIANDQVVIGKNADMIATHVPVVKGRLTVKGLLSLDYSGIQVTLVENGMTTTTDEDGYWSFEKVPVGSYTLKFERENTNAVTMAVDIVAAAEKNIGTIELIPNAASIEGHVTLNGLTDHSGITVRATADGMAELLTKTNAAGYFYIGNVVTTETYTVHFEKDGWVNQTRQVSGLENLSLNDITEVNPVKLLDITAPFLNSISVTVGNSELEGRKLNVYFNAVEEGSGISKVYVNTSNDFTDVEPINYSNPLSCYVPDTEGSYTLYVKVEDKSQNQSAISSQTFSIADYKTVVSGVILDNEDGLHDGVVTWTKARSPYYVSGNVLVDEDTTLIIEPGVNVQFSGDYYFHVEGKMIVAGTDEDNVFFYGVGSGENNWNGIYFVNNNVSFSEAEGNPLYTDGNRLFKVHLEGCNYGVMGYAFIEDSIFNSSKHALGGSNQFKGIIVNSQINGWININSGTAIGNTIHSEYVFVDSSNVISIFKGNEVFVSSGEMKINMSSINNRFVGGSITFSGNANNTSFEGCKLSLRRGRITNSSFTDCSFSSYSLSALNYCNLIGCDSIEVDSLRSNMAELDMRYNYWGKEKVLEMSIAGENGNLSFVSDYYDYFLRSRVNYSHWVTEPFSFVGYKGVFYNSYEITPQVPISAIAKVSSDYSVSIYGSSIVSVSTPDSIAIQYRVFDDVSLVCGSESDSKLWETLINDSVIIPYSDSSELFKFDRYVQFKDINGIISEIYQLNVFPLVIGPTGGFIFYDCDVDNSFGDADGLTSSDCGWRFLELSPKELDVRGVEFGYFRDKNDGNNLFSNGSTFYSSTYCTGTAVGDGYKNTKLLVSAMGECAYSSSSGSEKESRYAAKYCDDLEYEVNGIVFDDWFLPSKDELDLMITRLYERGIGDFEQWDYWSSSENPNDATSAWQWQHISGSSWAPSSRDQYDRVRPIRAF